MYIGEGIGIDATHTALGIVIKVYTDRQKRDECNEKNNKSISGD